MKLLLLLAIVTTQVFGGEFYCGRENRLDHPSVLRDHFMVKMSSEFDLETLHKTLGGTLKEDYTLHDVYHDIKTVHLTITNDDDIENLLSHPDVEFIECDREVQLDYIQNNDTSHKRATGVNAPSWGLDRVNQRDLPLDAEWNYSSHNGTDVHIFIIDTGISSSHPEFQGRLSDGFSTIRSWKKNIPSWDDGHGHGTHCAGTAAGTIYGLANNAILHAVRVLDNRGRGTLSDTIRGIYWVTNYHLAHDHPSVASMSLGIDYSPSINIAVHESLASGVIYSVAAGNSGTDACSYSPPSAEGVISVGASDINDMAPSWSNYGTCVDVYAPGVSITSAWTKGRTNIISGTSMACPHVTGAIALYLQEEPFANYNDVYQHLTGSATPGYPLNRANVKLLYIGDGFLTQPTAAIHESVSTPVKVCFDAREVCNSHSDCCSGRCSGSWKKRCK